MFGFISNLFGGDQEKPEAERQPWPLGLGPGLAYTIDTLNFRMNQGHLRFPLPDGEQIIAAMGSIPLGDGLWVYRFYPEEGPFLQVLSDRSGEDIKEVTWYQPVRSIYPVDQREWESWTGEGGRIGAPTFDYEEEMEDGTRRLTPYERLWMGDPDQENRYAPPVAMTETIEEPDEPSRMVQQQAMLYNRWVEEAQMSEYLLVQKESSGQWESGEGSVEIMLGVDINPAAFQRV